MGQLAEASTQGATGNVTAIPAVVPLEDDGIGSAELEKPVKHVCPALLLTQ